jgi:hypothetical protein
MGMSFLSKRDESLFTTCDARVSLRRNLRMDSVSTLLFWRISL